MTEAEWLASADPAAMLAHLCPGNRHGTSGQLVSDRKLRLFACACCHAMGHKDADALLRPVEHAADHGPVPMAAWHALERAMPCEGFRWCCRVDAVEAARVWAEATTIAGPAEKAALLREVVGNPYRPVTLPPPLRYARVPGSSVMIADLARSAYEARSFTHSLLILADALEDAGCTDETILRHLRQSPQRNTYAEWANGGGPDECPHGIARGLRCRECATGPHARGCWALDLLLGKE
jgi:hypothetical protein